MAAVKKHRTADAWKKKEWYTFFSPKSFEEREVGTTIAEEDAKIIGRVMKVPLREITNNMNHQFIKLIIKAREVKGKDVHTSLEGFELTGEYLLRNVRRRKSLIKTVVTGKTKDARTARVTAYSFTAIKIDTTKKDAIRGKMNEMLKKAIEEDTFDSLIQKCVFGSTASGIFKETKKISPIRRVEISKCRLVSEK
jgi:ribosomal protein S3AE